MRTHSACEGTAEVMAGMAYKVMEVVGVMAYRVTEVMEVGYGSSGGDGLQGYGGYVGLSRLKGHWVYTGVRAAEPPGLWG